ncbi:MAG: 3-deoxy-7-phosphoheptulonate synthase [Firmicutes bacterium HGW-Firmicutes-9]|jgi:3-deoxy-7-phosphoheptulonate synthase|nr:MAG: 3-deoxy-7-phosphoheptulonate synthase [Firmicutes bacterium HGW-Firmicutes-9]
MIVILKPNPNPDQLESLKNWLLGKGIQIHTSLGTTQMILGLVGDTSTLDIDLISALDIVEDVKRVQEPYKNANRKFHPEDTVIPVGNTQIGGGTLTIMAGPCSVESEAQIVAVAKAVKASGATMLRGGAFKPRTSPYAFQGMGAQGIELLKLARAETGLPIVSEIMDASQLPLFDDVDVIQVGARNMQNFNLLKVLGAQEKPVMIKRGLSSTYEEWLMSAEYVMASGNEKVILCERGIRTFETYTRNTLDLAAVPVLRHLTHLPVIIDPSHATGRYALVAPLAMGAVATGCDGLLIEVHNDPAHAMSDGPQSLNPEAFDKLNSRILALHAFMTSGEGRA